MIGEGVDPLFNKERCCGLGFSPRQAVDNAALSLMRVNHRHQLAFPIAPHFDGEMDIGAVEGGHKDLGAIREEFVDNIVSGYLVGGCRKRRDWHLGKQALEPREILIFRSKGGSPL